MITVNHLTKRYGSHLAVDDISFTVQDGEIVGFLGPNGAGKSTTMNMLTGYISSSSGEALINDINILDNPIQAKREIGYLPELPPLYQEMTVMGYLRFVYDLKKCKLPRKAHLTEICNLCKISDVQDRIIKNLSKGYRQRVGLAQALVGNPPILILDEPGAALDLEAKEQILWGLRQADLVKISDEEVEFLFGLGAREGAQYILGHFPAKLVFVTCGADGCWFQNRNAGGHVDSLKNIKVVDTTGAGDIFGGSAVWKLLQTDKAPEDLDEAELREIVSFACRAAGLSTMKHGGISSVPDSIS